MALDIQINGDTWTATGSIDLAALGLGTLTGMAPGTMSGNTLMFTFSATDLGSGSGTLTDTSVSGTGTVGPPLGFGDFTFTGTIGDSSLDGIFDFTSPTGGAGTAHLTRSVGNVERSWGELKADYR